MTWQRRARPLMLTSYSQKMGTYHKRHILVVRHKVKLSVPEIFLECVADAAKPWIFSLQLFFGLLLIIAIALLSAGCRHAVAPEQTFTHIRDEMRRGQLDAALHDVDAAYAQYQTKNQDWAARFRVQKAHT